MEVSRPWGGVPGSKTPFYADVTTRSDALFCLSSFFCLSIVPQRDEVTVPGCIQGMLKPTFARAPFWRLATVVPFHLLRGCFQLSFPRSFGGTELAITFGSTPQSSCIQGVGLMQLFCMHVRAVHLDHRGVGIYVVIDNIPPDSESERQLNMIEIVGVTP